LKAREGGIDGRLCKLSGAPASDPIKMANVDKNLVTHGFEQKLQQMKAGAEKHLPQNAPLELTLKQTTVGQVVADFDAILTRYQRVRDAAAALAQERRLLHDSMPAGHAEYQAFKSFLEAKLGRGNPQLGEYGLPLGVRQPRSSGTLVLAAFRARETRRIRHTLGHRQKLALSVKGPIVLLGPDGKAVSVEATATATPTANSSTPHPASPASGGGEGPTPTSTQTVTPTSTATPTDTPTPSG
jgi:hypothetical protein